MVLYSNFAYGSQFSGEKKQFVTSLHGLQAMPILGYKRIHAGFFKRPVGNLYRSIFLDTLYRLGDSIW